MKSIVYSALIVKEHVQEQLNNAKKYWLLIYSRHNPSSFKLMKPCNYFEPCVRSGHLSNMIPQKYGRHTDLSSRSTAWFEKASRSFQCIFKPLVLRQRRKIGFFRAFSLTLFLPRLILSGSVASGSLVAVRDCGQYPRTLWTLQRLTPLDVNGIRNDVSAKQSANFPAGLRMPFLSLFPREFSWYWAIGV